jgi:hypothetical protein
VTTLKITSAIWRLGAYQPATKHRPDIHGIAWRDGRAFATDGSSLVAIEDEQQVPSTWRVLLYGDAPTTDITVPLALGCHAVRVGEGRYAVVEIRNSGGEPVNWRRVVPKEEDTYRVLGYGVMETMLAAAGESRGFLRFYEPAGELAPMRLARGDNVIAVVMPVNKDRV